MISTDRTISGYFHPIFHHLHKTKFFTIFSHFFTICAYSWATPLPHLCYFCCCNDIFGQRATSGYYHSIFPPFAIYRHLSPFLAFLHHLCLLKSKLGPISACIDRNIFTRCCCSDTCKEKANPGYYHPTFPALAWKFNFWPFLAIFHHLSLLMGHPLIPPPLLLT